jgi:hypothetical protein
MQILKDTTSILDTSGVLNIGFKYFPHQEISKSQSMRNIGQIIIAIFIESQQIYK